MMSGDANLDVTTAVLVTTAAWLHHTLYWQFLSARNPNEQYTINAAVLSSICLIFCPQIDNEIEMTEGSSICIEWQDCNNNNINR